MSGLHPIEASALHARRERVYLVLAGLFLGSMTMLNILGVSRFIDFSFEVAGVTIPMALAVGVLPYPITFLCTDFISELYGQARANFLVWVGLGEREARFLRAGVLARRAEEKPWPGRPPCTPSIVLRGIDEPKP